jgi:trehalose-phosphatase
MDILEELRKDIEKSFPVLLLDYDGTLTPIASTPDEANLSADMHNILSSLLNKKDLVIAIISGRSLEDLKTKLGLDGVFFAGNYGMELEYRGFSLRFPDAQDQVKMIYNICKNLKPLLQNVDGVLIENKGLSASVHYRLVDFNRVSEVKKIVRSVLKPYIESGQLNISNGKKVLELLPEKRRDKGKSVSLILDTLKKENIGAGYLPIYLGDDHPDESAFEYLKGKGYTVIVSPRKRNTSADYQLNSVKEVRIFLEWLNDVIE